VRSSDEVSGSPGLTPRRDASGTLVVVPARPARIVSLIPSITELLFALGLEERIVGVTIF
jgi:iron complex transport system substrate-binding protein